MQLEKCLTVNTFAILGIFIDKHSKDQSSRLGHLQNFIGAGLGAIVAVCRAIIAPHPGRRSQHSHIDS